MTIINGYVKEDVIKVISSDSGGNLPFDVFVDATLNISEISGHNIPLCQQFVIVSGISEETDKKIKKINFTSFKSTETFIINAINGFLKTQVNKESDYLCEP